MTPPLQKAMLLAAGFGKRLQPLTTTLPKPLLPLNGQRLIDYSLTLLARGGIKEVIINVHHLGALIRDYVSDGHHFGLNVQYSEEPVILGTGGGIKNAARFFRREHVVVLNADTLIACDVRAVIAQHLSTKADATMVVHPRLPDDPFNPVMVHRDGTIRGFGNGDHFYTGLQIIGPKLVDILPDPRSSSCLIQDGYVPFLRQGGHVNAFIYTGYWNDVGTPERYKAAQHDVAQGRFRL